MMYTCPHCGQPGITTLRKALLGPGSQVHCRVCDKPVVVHFKPWLKAAAPGGLVMTGAIFFDSHVLMYGLSTVGFALMIALHLAWVPLAKQD